MVTKLEGVDTVNKSNLVMMQYCESASLGSVLPEVVDMSRCEEMQIQDMSVQNTMSIMCKLSVQHGI